MSDNDELDMIETKPLIDKSRLKSKEEREFESVSLKRHPDKPKTKEVPKQEERRGLQLPLHPQPAQLQELKETHERLIDKVLQLEEEMLSEHKG